MKVRILEDVDFWLNDRIYKKDEVLEVDYLDWLDKYVVRNEDYGSIDYLKPSEVEELEEC